MKFVFTYGAMVISRIMSISRVIKKIEYSILRLYVCELQTVQTQSIHSS